MELKGWINDTTPNSSPNFSWRRAKNILIDRIGSISNEYGLDFIGSLTDKPVIGVIPYDKGLILFSTNGSNQHSIGVYEKDINTYNEIINNAALNFSLDHPIEGVWKYNGLNELVVSFTDNYNGLRVVNLTNPDAIFNANKLEYFPATTWANYIFSIRDNGGSIKTGAYYTTFKYSNKNGISTPYFKISEPVYIIKDAATTPYDDTEGSEGGVITSKIIEIKIFNIDLSFDFVEIAIIAKINQEYNGYKIIKIPTSTAIFDVLLGQYYITYVYTGLDNAVETDITEFLTQNPVYNTCKSVTQIQNELIIGNLTSGQDFDYQKYANNIKVNFRAIPLNLATIKNPNTLALKGFMPFEVYALYIAFKLKKGGYSKAYHIPGRVAVTGEKAASTLASTGFSSAPLKYEIEDTSTNIGSGIFTECYHENKNETYPDISDFDIYDNSGLIGTLRNTPVRHHKAPSVEALRVADGSASYATNKGDILALDISDVYIPTEIADEVEGWEIFFAERTLDNITVYGQDSFIYGGKDVNTGSVPTNIYSRGVNFDYVVGGSSANTIGEVQPHIGKGHNFNLLRLKPSISPTFIRNELELSVSTTRVRSTNDWKNHILDYTGEYSVADTVASSAPSSDRKVRAITDFRYVPHDVIDGDIQNIEGEEHIQFELLNNTKGILTSFVDTAGINYDRSNNGIPEHKTALISYCALKDDVYINFQNQKLISTNITIDKAFSSASITGGDVTYTDWCFVTYSCIGDGGVIGSTYNKVHAAHRLLTHSVDSIALRYSDENDIQTYYYPKYNFTTDDGFNVGIQIIDVTKPYIYLYNPDYTSINNLTTVVPHDSYTKSTYKFPYRFLKTTNQNAENTNSTWGEFLANNYIDVPRDKGEIWKLESYGNALLINCKTTFYTAFIKDKLGIELSEIYVGSGDILDRPPVEAVASKHGYAGCQSQWATVVTIHGYIFIDKLQGKVFLFTGSNLKELSSEGIAIWLLKYLNTPKDTTDNPFMGNGLCAAYDLEFDRLLITKKHYVIKDDVTVIDFDPLEAYAPDDIIQLNGRYYIAKVGAPQNLTDIVLVVDELDGYGELISFADSDYFDDYSFTISYSFKINKWIGEHNYIPSYMVTDNNRHYLIDNNVAAGARIYQGNSKTSVGKYFNDLVYESYVDILGNLVEDVILETLLWNTDVEALDNSTRYHNKTFSKLFIYNNHSCTKLETFINITSLNKAKTLGLGRATNNKWYFNRIRNYIKDSSLPVVDAYGNIIQANIDTNKSWFKAAVLINTFFIYRLIFDNTTNQHKIYLNHFNHGLNSVTLQNNELI
jgi:hypothetical protein